ncbi:MULTISPECIES: hypothetical protein [unclassified Bradyrhizobium]|uniref:hypothetical protein n=1 Tax=unclassified Bradyrhizobium TaxID=2631580 RepID=UPI002916129D|nr:MULTISPECIES: hypothetical protein [unclassified Bradyrhizobium]
MSAIESFLVAVILLGLVLFPVALIFSDPLGITSFLYLIAIVPVVLLSGLTIFFIRRKRNYAAVKPSQTSLLIRILRIVIIAGAFMLAAIFVGLWAVVIMGF